MHFNGAGVCTPDGTRPRHSLQTRTDASMEPEFALRMEPTAVFVVAILIAASMEPEFALRMEPALSSSGGVFCLLQWSRSLHSGWNAAEAVGRVVRFPASMEPEFALRMEPPSAPTTTARSMLQWSPSLHSGWNCSLKIAKENKPCKRLFRAPERRGRIFLSIQHGGRKNSFILADCHCENPPL